MKFKYFNGTSWVELTDKSELGSLAFLNTLDKLNTSSGYLQFSGSINAYDLHKNQKRSGGLSDLDYYYQLPSEGTLASPVILASRSWVINQGYSTLVLGNTSTTAAAGDHNHDSDYLGITAKAADADKLDGNDSAYYLNYNNLTNTPTIPAAAKNGTLTIKVAGTQKGTFGANQSSNTTIDITAADLGLGDALHFIGTSSTAVTDGGTENPTISGYSGTAKTQGNVLLYNGKEYVWTGSAWEQLGDESSWALKTTQISAGTGLTGGGTLASNRTLSLADNYGDTKNPYASKTANYVLAAPNGSAGAPSFRALVAADIPSLNASKINAGTFDASRIPSLNASKINAGTFDTARIPSLDASKIGSGTLDSARIPDLSSIYATASHRHTQLGNASSYLETTVGLASGDLHLHIDAITSGNGLAQQILVNAVDHYYIFPREGTTNNPATLASRAWVNNQGFLTSPSAILYSYINMESATLYKDGIIVTGNFPVTPAQSGGAMYKFPLDEGASEFTFATREWTQDYIENNTTGVQFDMSGNYRSLDFDIGEMGSGYGYGSYRGRVQIYASYSILYLDFDDGNSVVTVKDKRGSKELIRYRHHICIANASIKAWFTIENQTKNAYSNYSGICGAIYGKTIGGYRCNTGDRGLMATGYDLTNNRSVCAIYATGSSSGLYVVESNGSGVSFSSTSFGVTDRVEVV